MRFIAGLAVLILILCQGPLVYAVQKQSKITTQYPAPYGKYSSLLSANELSAKKASLGGSNLPVHEGDVTFKAQTTLTDGTGTEGELAYYDTDTSTVDGTEKFQYYDGTNWQQLGGNKVSFGDFSTADGAGATYVKNTVYQAATDGFVMAHMWVPGDTGALDGYTASTTVGFSTPGTGNLFPPALMARTGNSMGFIHDNNYIMFPVKKGHYWAVKAWTGELSHDSWEDQSGSTQPIIQWIPLDFS